MILRGNTAERTGFDKSAADFKDVLKNLQDNGLYEWIRPTRLPVSRKAIKLIKLLGSKKVELTKENKILKRRWRIDETPSSQRR
ncbi:unnamed protein product [Blumeria hordei]|uniref:Uncharacterized protein n=1 Tax=Blumeria hordei TaxID=2867405 RepID=A0A383UIB6_BLUHO|nr:unnamed protein product [Blumeria hordei]